MNLFKVELEETTGKLATVLVVAGDAMEAYSFVAKGDTVVHEVSRENGFAPRGRTRIAAVVKEHRV